MERAEKIENIGYTAESWAELILEIEKANILLNSDNPDPEEVEVEKRLLNEKMIKLHLNQNIKGVNKTDLYNQIQIANKVGKEILDKVIQSVVDEFRISLNDATNGLYNDHMTQEAVDLLYQQLKEVYELLLESKVDKSQLTETIHKVSQLHQKDYTDESWKELIKVLKEANKILDDKEASQKEVNQMQKDLHDAIEALVKKPDDNKPSDTDKPTDIDKPTDKPVDDNKKPDTNKPSIDSDVLGEEVDTTNKPTVKPNQTTNIKAVKTGDDVMIAPYTILAMGAVVVYMTLSKRKHG